MTYLDRTDTHRRTHRRNGFSWILLWISTLVALAALLFLWWTSRYQARIYPGVVVGSVHVGGLSLSDAHRILTRAYADPVVPPVEVTYEDRSWFLFPQLRGDTRTPLLQAYAYGRTGSLWDQIREQLRGLWYGAYFPGPRFHLMLGEPRRWFNALAASLYRPLEEPSVMLTSTGILYAPGRPGQEVDIPRSWHALEQALEQATQTRALVPPVPLILRRSGPQPLDVHTLNEQVTRLLTQPFLLDMGDRVLALDTASITKVVQLTPQRHPDGRVDVLIRVQRNALRTLLEDLAERYRRTPIDARLDYDPNTRQFIVLSPSADGWDMDVDAATEKVANALEAGNTSAQIPAHPVPPAVPMDATPEELGIREIVAEGRTSFRGSSAARVRNIIRAAEAVRGVVIPPGGVFSFNESAGAITAANGYEDSLIIWGDRTAVGIGGGVCQVSTTLFRAAFFAGLPILERWNHGYIVSWYGEPGMDATVYSPYVDLKFQNTTPAYLLIQPVIDTQKGILTFRLWGTKPDWTVEIEKPVYEDVQDPPPPLYIEDPTLPKGTIKQVEWPKKGMTVRITRIVRRGDEIIEKKEFVSKYEPWRAIYLYGPGTKLPKGAQTQQQQTQQEEGD